MISVICCKDYDEMSEKAATIVENAIAEKPDLVLGLATGSTPEGMYAALCRDYRNGKVDFSRVTTVNLDEYCGIPSDHEQSYLTFMKKNLFDHVNLNKTRTFLPDGSTKDPETESSRYEKMVADLGYADLQILGVGRNGHIGFNEPADTMLTKTHMTPLSKETIRDNSRFFASADEVPRRAITMGVGTIMNARRLVLMASGKSKENALRALFGGIVNTIYPVTLLQLHRDVTLICDEDAFPFNK